jgi:hypothetical protein
MREFLAWCLLLSPFVVIVLVGVGLSCLFMRSCPACKMRISRSATRCHWCHTDQEVAVAHEG